MKRLVVFDLDGTLAKSKSALDREMAGLLGGLLQIVKVAIISGGDFPQFEHQVLSNLTHDQPLKELSLLPTCGTKFYHYESGWKKLYSEDFGAAEKERITRALKQVIASSQFGIEKTWANRSRTAAAKSRSPHSDNMRLSTQRRSGTPTSANGKR